MNMVYDSIVDRQLDVLDSTERKTLEYSISDYYHYTNFGYDFQMKISIIAYKV